MSDQTATEPTGPAPGDSIRAKWLMDGATTLAEAALGLETFAAHLREIHEKGWTLAGPVQDDYGFLVSPDGDAGPTGEDHDDADGSASP